MKKILTSLLFLILTISLPSQIVTLSPTFPDRDEEVTITYDATQGSAGLVGVSQVYMHTGLITGASNSTSDWKFVVGNWGTDDSRVKMTNIGNDLHQLKIVINDFYNVPQSEMIEMLAFVFRNVDGSKEGKTAQFGDIFLNYVQGSAYSTQLIAPTQNNIVAELDETIAIIFGASEISSMTIMDNNVIIYEELTDQLNYSYVVLDEQNHNITITAEYEAESAEAQFSIIVRPEVTVAALPIGSKYGMNKVNPTSYRLVLLAPSKNNAYVIGDFNDWQVNNNYFMNRTPEGDAFWIEIDGLDPDKNYAFQYLIDGEIVVADPFSELVLDPINDQEIPAATFPDLPTYPQGQTTGYVSMLKTSAESYEWQYDIEKPAVEDLVIYELLMRDFTAEQNYQTLLDTLAYLENLGVNAIEFMPINEFEGNQSWGYNPSFHMALDKYYGTPLGFKAVVDECHKRGIAVILDVVYNHAFSQSPLARMYWDATNFRPSADSPFLNAEARHPFNVGYDFNHESVYTQAFVERVTQYWLTEYKVDGFRFDLSKGFTQRMSTNDGEFAAYDQNRIDVLKLYADKIWEVDADAYVILEHFGANDEEKELAAYGMMLWSNHVFNFNEGTMGYNTGDKSNFEWIDYKKKGWTEPHAVGYMESHDEERLMYKNLEFGNGNGSYQVKELETALKRIELATVFFYGMPGPKMLWQFGEMGYDFSINRCENGTISDNCRLSPKPIRWDYKEDLNRKRIIDVTSAMIALKTNFDITATDDYRYNVTAARKHLVLEGSDTDAVIVGNFDVIDQSIDVTMPSTGRWYDYLKGDSLTIDDLSHTFALAAGEYLVLTDVDLGGRLISGAVDIDKQIIDYSISPNPANKRTSIHIAVSSDTHVAIEIIDLGGQIVRSNHQFLHTGENVIDLDLAEVPGGLYHIVVQASKFRLVDRLVIAN